MSISRIGFSAQSSGWRCLQWTFVLALLAMVPARVAAQGTGFTYQGRLVNAGVPANGSYDLAVSVWNATSAGSLLGGPVTNSAVVVTNGLFTISIDFGAGIFTGQARWLELSVRTNGSGPFSVLSPRQRVDPSPYAITAANATTAAAVTGSVAASQIAGTLSPANLAAGSISASNLAPNAVAASLNAAGQSGVSSGGTILSTDGNNTNLLNAGYVKIYGSFGTPDAWQAYTNAPTQGPPTVRSSHSAVWTGSEMIIWGGYNGAYLNDGARYNPAADSWSALPVSPGASPSGRLNHTAIWTGSSMIVWGGVGGTNYFNDGGIYDPVLGVWSYLSGNLSNAPSARLLHTSVWTGNAMIVWGGTGGAGSLNDGGAYNPGLGSWATIPNSLSGTPAARVLHSAIWSGTELIIWGGAQSQGGSLLNDGGRYNPASNTWNPIANSLANTPVARQYHTAVWTGTSMIIWGGAGAAVDLNDGAIYSPSGNSWIALAGSIANTPAIREQHTAVWSGTEMIVWGGYSSTSGGLVNSGGRFNPIGNVWTAIAGNLLNSPSARLEHSAVWSGTEMIVWGGTGISGPLNDGGRYNPTTASWRYLPGTTLNIPPSRSGHTAVWSGSEMIVWGGVNNGSSLGDGGRFNPAVNSWVYLPGTLANSPSGRSLHTAVWSGTEMIIWGGVNGTGFLNDGGRYNATTGSWTPILNSLGNTPSARDSHSAIWTGTQMIIWGGLGNPGNFGDGGIFSPVAGTWATLAAGAANSPAPRMAHTAVWTGSEMIVWGGSSNSTSYADGARLNPVAGTWVAVASSLANAPSARSSHTAVWTGSEMLVWGGVGGGAAGPAGDGGRFNPTANSWLAVLASLPNSPVARSKHSAVWTGSEMVIWGGLGNGGYLGDGSRYSPSAGTWNSLPASLANSPAARARHSAVWTGSSMLIWGGGNGAADFNDTTGLTPGRVLFLYQRP